MKITNHLMLFCAVLTVWPEGVYMYSTLQFDITTMSTNVTFYNDTGEECYCDCSELETVNSVPTTIQEAEVAAEKLSEALKLNKTSLSSTTRRKTSASDSRPSAQGMGYVGVLVIVFVIGSIVALDFTMLVRDVRVTYHRLFGPWTLQSKGLPVIKGGTGGGGNAFLSPSGGEGVGVERAVGGFQQPNVGGAAVHHAQSSISAGQLPPTYTEEDEQNEGAATTNGQNKFTSAAAGYDATGNKMAPLPLPATLSSSGVQDIRSRRELLMMHHGPAARQ